jgi:hypothetical protein
MTNGAACPIGGGPSRLQQLDQQVVGVFLDIPDDAALIEYRSVHAADCPPDRLVLQLVGTLLDRIVPALREFLVLLGSLDDGAAMSADRGSGAGVRGAVGQHRKPDLLFSGMALSPYCSGEQRDCASFCLRG